MKFKSLARYYRCVAEAEFTSTLKQEGESLRKVEVGEIVEVTDGPKKECCGAALGYLVVSTGDLI